MTRCGVEYHHDGKPSSQLNTAGNQVKRVHGVGDGERGGNACGDPDPL